jgi:competence protein ComEC
MQISEFNILNDKLSELNDKEPVVLTGIIIKEPELKDNSQKLKIKIGQSIILATTNRYPEYQYLDIVEISGKLETPMETEDFNYKKYLLKEHIYSVMFFPEIKIIGKSSRGLTSGIFSGVLWIKEKLRDSIRNNFLPPNSSILEGVILGDKNAISQEIKEKFRITGLSHIIAVSGMHVVILSSIVMIFLIYIGMWRNQAFYGAVIFIIVYVVLVGLPSSAIRAGVMGIFYLLGQKIGRQTVSSRTIVISAVLMLLINPLLLFYDIGFQLSFLAVLGLIYLEPLIRNFIKLLIFKISKFKVKEKNENVIMFFSATISAQIFTLPIIIYNFGNISFVSLITNVLVLPVIYGIMLFGFLSSVAGIFITSLGWILSLPCYFLLNYFFWIVNIFSKPWAYSVVENVSWIWILISYLLLIFITGYFYKKISFKI